MTRPPGCSLLPSIENHIAYKIWNDPDSLRLLTVINHGRKCNEWVFDDLREPVKAKITTTGLQNLSTYSYKMVDNALISAFVERWHPETNTFHLPAGEMTITLDDVQHILGVRVDGRAMMHNYYDGDLKMYEEIVDTVSNYLQVPADHFTTIRDFKKSYGLPLKFLEDTFKDEDDDDDEDDDEEDEDEDDAVVRGYIQFILGSVGVPDKSGTSIHAKYLYNLLDVDTIDEISWGSGILAYLYRELGAASRIGSKTIAGCQTLLHAWIYEHFPMLKRATLNRDYDEQLPRMCKWKPAKVDAKHGHTLAVLRIAIEDMHAEEIVWHPYRDMRSSTRPLHPIALYHGLISCHDIEEPYMPDRVLRQFGYVQTIPKPLGLVTGAGGTKPLNYVPPVHRWASYFFSEWQQHVIGAAERQEALQMWDCIEDYMTYYVSAGHGLLLNPHNRKGRVEIVPPNLPSKSVLYAALLKMANKAKNLGRSLISCGGNNYKEVGTQLQDIANVTDFPFLQGHELRSKSRHDS